MQFLKQERCLPWIEGKFHLHQYKIAKNAPNSKIYRVVARGGDGKACVMLVQMFKPNPDRLAGFVSDNVWIINFVKEGQSDFDVTGSGSLDAFNTVFATIQVMINDIHPDYIAYKPTDSDQTKSAQKARIYSGYFTRMGLSEYPKAQLPDSMQNLTVFKA